jgi:acyl carrier protein
MLVKRVLAVIASATKVPPEQMSLDSTFAELGIDSLQGLNLLFEIEKEFHLNIPNPYALNILGVRDLVESLEKMLEESGVDLAKAE